MEKGGMKVCHTFDRVVHSAKRGIWTKQQDDLLQAYSKNKKEFWRYIGNISIANDRNKPPNQLLQEDGVLITDSEEIMKEWKQYFSSLLNKHIPLHEDGENRPIPNPNVSHIDPQQNQLHQHVMNRPIAQEEVILSLRKAKLEKSVGTDNIPMEILKNGEMIPVLHMLFNACFSSGQIPASWKKSIITPIPKTGDVRVTSNYRGISVACSMYKLYCSILNNRFITWSEELELIQDEQNGFRKSRSCVDHLSSLSMIVDIRKTQKRSTFCAFIDFRKAYDSIQRDLLWHKLKCYGLQGKIMDALQGIYSAVYSAVKVNGQLTEWFEVALGLKQGCLISPFCFNMYLNDLINDINSLGLGVNIGDRNVSIMCYADDIVLIARKEQDLQCMLDKLEEWCNSWNMYVNEEKTKVVHFRPSSSEKSTFNFTCGESNIKTVTKYKYLGLVFNEHLDYRETAKMVSQSAHRALGVLIAKDKAHGGMPYNIFTRLYDTLVQPIISYGAAIWGQKYYGIINSVQQRAMKYFLGLPKRAPNSAVIGDMGWTDSTTRLWVSVGRQWCRLRNMETSRLNKVVFDWGYNVANRNVKNWVSLCLQKWKSLGFQDDRYNPIVSNHFIRNIEEQLEEQVTRIWIADINRDESKTGKGRNKLHLYKGFKSDRQVEPYITMRLSRSHRAALARFRAGVPLINVELGRYRNLPLDQRRCVVCNTIEDECHVLLDCPVYENIRQSLLQSIHDFVPSFNEQSRICKMGIILSHKDLIKVTAKACYELMEERKRIINIDMLHDT
jgi:hypothetical protein